MFDYIDGSNRQHVLDLIEWFYKESLSAGGDGDGLWYSRFYSVNELLPLVEEVNLKHDSFWKIKLDGNVIFWGRDQESVIITNNKEDYDNCPDYVQAKLRY